MLRILLALCLAVPSAPLVAQASDAAPPPDRPLPPRRFTVTAGLGNAMGWLGAQGERYFAGDRLSAFGGLGYTPAADALDPTGVTFAAGFRGYTPGRHHRGFLELSVSEVETCGGCDTRIENGLPVTVPGRYYGPGLQAGWQYAGDGGFTVMASVGAGYAIDLRDFQVMLNLGMGFTWR